MSLKITPRKVVLCILDGWGEAQPGPSNGISSAPTPNFSRFKSLYPISSLATSGETVGLPEGQMGNSEVGHMTLGAGRVFFQDLPRISQAIETNVIWQQPALRTFTDTMQQKTRCCHVIGLLSPGGVHAHQEHLLAMCSHFAQQGIKVCVHALLDGRDTPPQSGMIYLREFLAQIEKMPAIQLVTLSGRYYAMDRDKRWERVEEAYHAIVHAKGKSFRDPLEAVSASYQAGITDEFLLPWVSEAYQGINSQDGIFIANFRADRVIQLLTSLTEPSFQEFDRQGFYHEGPRLGMTRYSERLSSQWPALFPPHDIKDTLGEVLSHAGKRQLRLAETEKYAHVTYFFNGGREDILPGEERILVPSPRVASYDLQPEMSAFDVTAHLVKAIESEQFDLIVVNFANADMVGHTGNLKATRAAIACLDKCLGEIEVSLQNYQTTMLVTADHGNAEEMYDAKSSSPHTAHTLNKVPLIIVNPLEELALKAGTLQDIAPTVLTLLGLPVPSVMQGTSLIVSSEKGTTT